MKRLLELTVEMMMLINEQKFKKAQKVNDEIAKILKTYEKAC
jgi:dihydrodipicolinate synthase/N-acetylneuraminate lyase